MSPVSLGFGAFNYNYRHNAHHASLYVEEDDVHFIIVLYCIVLLFYLYFI